VDKNIGGIKLALEDRDAIIGGRKLNNLVINFAQKVPVPKYKRVSVNSPTGQRINSNFEHNRADSNSLLTWGSLDCSYIY